MQKNGVLEKFFKKHWKRGLSTDGQRILNLYERVNARNNDACHIEQNVSSGELDDLLLQTVVDEFDDAVKKSLNLSASIRRKRLQTAKRIPEKVIVRSIAYKRNADVVAEVLLRAKGKCESCGNKAPFNRASDDTPYLEVHHKKQLSLGGEDTLENAIAVCPNCHRKAHFG